MRCYVGLVAVGVQEQAEDILAPPLLRNCLTLMTFHFPSHYYCLGHSKMSMMMMMMILWSSAVACGIEADSSACLCVYRRCVSTYSILTLSHIGRPSRHFPMSATSPVSSRGRAVRRNGSRRTFRETGQYVSSFEA